jgi:hypothetical protein
VCGKSAREGRHSTDFGEGHDYVPLAVAEARPALHAERYTFAVIDDIEAALGERIVAGAGGSASASASASEESVESSPRPGEAETKERV